MTRKIVINPNTVELVYIHGPDAGFDLVVAGLKLLDGFGAGSVLGAIGIRDSVAEPVEDGRRDNELLQNPAELARGDFLARCTAEGISRACTAAMARPADYGSGW
jgi:hypothetical protein